MRCGKIWLKSRTRTELSSGVLKPNQRDSPLSPRTKQTDSPQANGLSRWVVWHRRLSRDRLQPAACRSCTGQTGDGRQTLRLHSCVASSSSPPPPPGRYLTASWCVRWPARASRTASNRALHHHNYLPVCRIVNRRRHQQQHNSCLTTASATLELSEVEVNKQTESKLDSSRSLVLIEMSALMLNVAGDHQTRDQTSKSKSESNSRANRLSNRRNQTQNCFLSRRSFDLRHLSI